MSENTESPIACDLSVLTEEQRARHEANAERVWGAIEGTRELERGFAFRFAYEPSLIAAIGEFIAYESLCCPFLDFSLQVEGEHGRVWLSVGGREGVKEYLKQEMPLPALEE